MIMEQILVRGDTCSPGPPETSHPRDTPQTPLPQRNRVRPKGSRNRNKTSGGTQRYLETDSNADEGVAETY